MQPAMLYSLTGVLLCSILSLLGMMLFSIRKGFIERIMLYLISFSTGALLGDVFLHMLPEMVEVETGLERAWYLILLGIILSFVLEKFIHWHHCHMMPCGDHYHPIGTMNLIGDTLHNILDGILIAGSFLVSTELGIATTVAVIFHEIPQEMGDFAILLFSGYSKGRALLFNFLTTLSALIGASAVLLFSQAIPELESVIIPLTIGNFLYLAGSDLIPELHKETAARRSILQLLCIIIGIGFMASLTMLE